MLTIRLLELLLDIVIVVLFIKVLTNKHCTITLKICMQYIKCTLSMRKEKIKVAYGTLYNIFAKLTKFILEGS